MLDLRTAHAQQKPAIGFLGAGAAESTVPLVEALKQGLGENGLAEDKDYAFEPRWAEGRYERFPMFARELVDGGARVIVVTTIAGAHAAQRATSVIPIVMANLNDPVGNGLVASLARPGGNRTGMATLDRDVSPSVAAFLLAWLPRAAAIAALLNRAKPRNPAYLESVRRAAAARGIEVRPFLLKAPADLNNVFVTIAVGKPDGLLVIPDASTLDLGALIAA